MKKLEFIEFIKWSHKSDENKKKAISFIHSLEKAINENKELSKEDLDKITGGFTGGHFFEI